MRKIMINTYHDIIMNKHTLLLLVLFFFSHSLQAIEEGQTAPQCPATNPTTQKTVDPSILRGKVILVDFWATWCPPCLKSMPFFNSLFHELPQDKFEIIAINVDEDSDTVNQFLQEHPVDYPIAFDPKGECPKIYNVKAMPSSYLLDKKGVVRKIHLGYRDGDQTVLRNDIAGLLNE
jgi:thiol-disulfide isomerase/thioredoxin